MASLCRLSWPHFSPSHSHLAPELAALHCLWNDQVLVPEGVA